MAKEIITYESLKTSVSQWLDKKRVADPAYMPTKDEITNLLVKIGAMKTITYDFRNQLKYMVGEFLPRGRIIEEWYEDALLPLDIADVDDVNEDDEGLDKVLKENFAPRRASFKKTFYSYPQTKKLFKSTLDYDLYQKVSLTDADVQELMNKPLANLYSSTELYEYQIGKQLIATAIDRVTGLATGTAITTTYAASQAYDVTTYLKSGTEYGVTTQKISATDNTSWADLKIKGYVVLLNNMVSNIELPTDADNGAKFVVGINTEVENARLLNQGYSLTGNLMRLDASDTIDLYLRKGIMPQLKGYTMAGAFHDEYLGINARIHILEDFGNAPDNVVGFMCDRRALKIHPYFDRFKTTELLQETNFNRIVGYTLYMSGNTYMKVLTKTE